MDGLVSGRWCRCPYETSNLGKRCLSQIWPKDDKCDLKQLKFEVSVEVDGFYDNVFYPTSK